MPISGVMPLLKHEMEIDLPRYLKKTIWVMALIFGVLIGAEE